RLLACHFVLLHLLILCLLVLLLLLAGLLFLLFFLLPIVARRQNLHLEALGAADLGAGRRIVAVISRFQPVFQFHAGLQDERRATFLSQLVKFNEFLLLQLLRIERFFEALPPFRSPIELARQFLLADLHPERYRCEPHVVARSTFHRQDRVC